MGNLDWVVRSLDGAREVEHRLRQAGMGLAPPPTQAECLALATAIGELHNVDGAVRLSEWFDNFRAGRREELRQELEAAAREGRTIPPERAKYLAHLLVDPECVDPPEGLWQAADIASRLVP